MRGRNIVKKGVNTIGFKKASTNAKLSKQKVHKLTSQGTIKSDSEKIIHNSEVVQNSNKVYSSNHNQKDKNQEPIQMPKGLKVLMVYSVIVAFFYLLLIFLSDSTVFFGILTEGVLARLVFFLFFILTVLIVFGIAYKKQWCYKFSIVVYVICILNSVFSIFFISRINDSLITSLYSLIIPIFIITLLMNFLTLWYIYEKRLYFTDPNHVHRHSLADDVFIYTIYMFYFFVAVFIIVLGGMIYISATKNISYVMSVTSGLDVSEAESYCESLTDPEAMDMCFISVVYNNRAESDISKLCNSVKLSYYKYTCLKIVGK